MHGKKITLDAVQINADNLLIQEYSMFKDVNISELNFLNDFFTCKRRLSDP